MAAVIKKHDLAQGTGAPQPVAFNVEDVQSRARTYLQDVRRQADQILAEAQVEAEKLHAAAKEQGRLEAEREFEQRVESAARQLSDARCKTAVAACENWLSQIAENNLAWLANWRAQTVSLAGRIAEKVVRREMQDHEELLRVWLEEALVAMRDAREIRILINPDDFATAGRYLQQLVKKIPQAANAELLPDPEIKAGGCVVRNQYGLIDQQLDSQIQRLVEQLR